MDGHWLEKGTLPKKTGKYICAAVGGGFEIRTLIKLPSGELADTSNYYVGPGSSWDGWWLSEPITFPAHPEE